MNWELIGDVTQSETFAEGSKIRELHRLLERRYFRSRKRKPFVYDTSNRRILRRRLCDYADSWYARGHQLFLHTIREWNAYDYKGGADRDGEQCD